MANRKIETFHDRKESLPEILVEIKRVLETTDSKKPLLLIEIHNTGYFEAVIVWEA